MPFFIRFFNAFEELRVWKEIKTSSGKNAVSATAGFTGIYSTLPQA